MSKKINIEKAVMSRIKSGKVSMKPKIYFTLASVGLFVGLVGLTVFSVFMTSIIAFSLRSHGPMGQYRLQELLTNIPVWSLIVGVVSLTVAIFILKKFDISYKYNFVTLSIVFILLIIATGLVLNYSGLDEVLRKKGPMRNFYRQSDSVNIPNRMYRFRNRE